MLEGQDFRGPSVHRRFIEPDGGFFLHTPEGNCDKLAQMIRVKAGLPRPMDESFKLCTPAARIGRPMSGVRNEVDLDRAGSALATADSLCSLAVGQVLRDRYVLQARLGTGAKGAVFKALDRFRTTLPETQQYVALKILHAGGDCPEQTLAKLRLEFHCAQALSHRNVVNVYELDRDGDVVFFTMELLDGEPLSDVIERLHPAAMRREQAWQLIQQLGAGLAHAHERGVVHGDLKPRNIFITREGELRILDFGAAHRFTAVSPSERADNVPTSGTPAYASCEQLEGRRADPRDDLYALACICYELLAGTHPFGSRPATLARDYRVSLARPDGITGRQWRALQKGLSWHRAGRSISVRLWMHRLIKDSVQEHSMTPLQELTQSNPVQSKIPWRAAALFLVATLATVAVLAQLRSTSALKTIDAPAPVLSVAANRDVDSALPNAPPVTDVVATPASASATKDIEYGAPRPKATARTIPLTISVEPSQVSSDDHFAEIRLQRNRLQKNSSFTWWTEPATAKPDVDYVPEAVAVQTFPAGYRSTRLYVRLLPQSLRSQRSYFYIAIAQPGPHQTPATVIRRQVWLPMSSNLQAHR
jgi:serine/threonine protein kinase